MTSSGNNPFVFPGFTPGTDAEQNPISASVEMMRGAWQNLAGAGVLGQTDLTQPVTVEDLDRRIAQLKTIENWLQLNLSMLASTTQALQVQRATIATLQSFMGMPGVTAGADNPSPLEVALGIKPAGQAKIRPAQSGAAPATEDTGASAEQSAAMVSEAAKNWWNMLQQQFNVLASATASTLQAGQEAEQQADATATAPPPQEKAASARPAAGKKAARSAARKTSTARKSTGK